MGASWLTTVFGGLTILGDIGAFVAHYMQENPPPMKGEQWFAYGMGLVTGVGLIVSKSFNVSNSQQPAAATVVPAVAAATPNPAAAVKP